MRQRTDVGRLDGYPPAGAGSSAPVPARNGASHSTDLGSALGVRSLAAIRLSHARVRVRGRYFVAGRDTFYVRGVVYDTFRPSRNGTRYPEPVVVARDFAQLAARGVNTVRTYVLPPRWLLDVARDHGLRVIVGVLPDRPDGHGDDTRELRRVVGAAVRSCAGHPAVLGYAIGHELGTTLVRDDGAQRAGKQIYELYQEVKREDPEALVTYVNSPATEYLDLPFLDFASCDVSAGTREQLESYLAQLRTSAGARPLVVAQLGQASERSGARPDGEAADWQLRTVVAAGCAGVCIVARPDERECDISNGVALLPARHDFGVATPAWPADFTTPLERPTVRGKFLFVGDEKLYIRGVTYGTFRPRPDGSEFPEPQVVAADFAQMAAHGINAVRTYTVPPRWLLDTAQRNGLRVLVGVPMERYIGFLADRGRKDAPSLTDLVREGVTSCAGHPAVLAYSLGNEIPAAIVRWHGARRVERYLEELYRAAKSADPAGLFTYVNYPSTEYLDLPFLDFVCFNVYLEKPDRLEAYLARLQCLAGDVPLVMGELGLDTVRNGESAQSESLTWQIRTAFAGGCAGAFVYSWTDEWHRGGEDVEDWGFGLTRRDRTPKPALAAVRQAFADAPFPPGVAWPRISVVVCTYNGRRTIGECLAALEQLDYPDYEVIVVDDGSTDGAGSVARRYRCRVIRTSNQGLSNARNTGLAAATGSIVAYLDDDAYPDAHWLRYLALTFLTTSYAGVGGPNLPPPGDGWIADCIAHSPGNPVHVLLSDREAEHIPGCNMAFRKSALEAVGGFDPQFRAAGDDVDLCWRLTDAGLMLGFNPAAMVWHHRRGSLRAYWKQQRGYGRAEGMLEVKWPARHDKDGHAGWTGRIYGTGVGRVAGWGRPRIYHGVWGSAPFQSLYEPATGNWSWLTRSPVWYLVNAMLAALAVLGVQWQPLRLAIVPLVIAGGITLLEACRHAARQRFVTPTRTAREALRMRVVTGALYLLQPVARLSSRLAFALETPRRRSQTRLAHLWQRTTATWVERWEDPLVRLSSVESALREEGAVVRRGGAFDWWDLEVRAGSFGSARLQLAVEEHGRGCQLVRVRAEPRCRRGPLITAFCAALTVAAFGDGAWLAAGGLGLATAFFAVRTVSAVAGATDTARRALARVGLAGDTR